MKEEEELRATRSTIDPPCVTKAHTKRAFLGSAGTRPLASDAAATEHWERNPGETVDVARAAVESTDWWCLP
jgi:hypothetical protein